VRSWCVVSLCGRFVQSVCAVFLCGLLVRSLCAVLWCGPLVRSSLSSQDIDPRSGRDMRPCSVITSCGLSEPIYGLYLRAHSVALLSSLGLRFGVLFFVPHIMNSQGHDSFLFCTDIIKNLGIVLYYTVCGVTLLS
jgi:hypothetical protein